MRVKKNPPLHLQQKGLIMGERYCCSKCHNHVTLPGTILMPTTLYFIRGVAVDSVHKPCLLNIELGVVSPLNKTREFECNSCHGVLGFIYIPETFFEKLFFYRGSIVKHQKNHKVIESAKKNGKAPADTSLSDAAAHTSIVEQITQMINSLSHKVEAGFAKIDAQFNAVEGRFKTIDGCLDVVRDDVKNIDGRLDGVQHNVKDVYEAMLDAKAEFGEFNSRLM